MDNRLLKGLFETEGKKIETEDKKLTYRRGNLSYSSASAGIKRDRNGVLRAAIELSERDTWREIFSLYEKKEPRKNIHPHTLCCLPSRTVLDLEEVPPCEPYSRQGI